MLPLSEQEQKKNNSNDAGLASMVVGVFIETGNYDGLVLLKKADASTSSANKSLCKRLWIR